MDPAGSAEPPLSGGEGTSGSLGDLAPSSRPSASVEEEAEPATSPSSSPPINIESIDSPGAQCMVPNCEHGIKTKYEARYKLCTTHMKCPMFIISGVHCRFCQKCGKFHHLDEFDGDRRSCRVSLQRHCDKQRRLRTRKARAQQRAKGGAAKAAKAKAAALKKTSSDEYSLERSLERSLEHSREQSRSLERSLEPVATPMRPLQPPVAPGSDPRTLNSLLPLSALLGAQGASLLGASAIDAPPTLADHYRALCDLASAHLLGQQNPLLLGAQGVPPLSPFQQATAAQPAQVPAPDMDMVPFERFLDQLMTEPWWTIDQDPLSMPPVVQLPS